MIHVSLLKNWHELWPFHHRAKFAFNGLKKLCVWVPHALSQNHKNQWVAICASLLAHHRLAREQHQSSTAVEQVVACVLVTQRARFDPWLGQVSWVRFFRGFSSPVRQMSGSFRPPRSPNIIWPSLSSILIHYGRQWPEMLTCPKTSNIQYHTTASIILILYRYWWWEIISLC